MFSKVISAISRVGSLQMIVVVDMIVLDDSREFGIVEFFVSKQIHFLQFTHASDQSFRAINGISIRSKGFHEGPLEIGLFISFSQ